MPRLNEGRQLLKGSEHEGACAFFGLVGNDEFGKMLRRRITDAGVRDMILNAEEGVGSGVCIVLSGPTDRGFITQVCAHYREIGGEGIDGRKLFMKRREGEFE